MERAIYVGLKLVDLIESIVKERGLSLAQASSQVFLKNCEIATRMAVLSSPRGHSYWLVIVMSNPCFVESLPTCSLPASPFASDCASKAIAELASQSLICMWWILYTLLISNLYFLVPVAEVFQTTQIFLCARIVCTN